jgi:hypothetical protein
LIAAYHDNKTFYKIGWTKRDPNKRLKELKTANSHDLELIHFYESKWGPRIEINLHRKFNPLKRNGEWFELSDNDVNSFKELCEYHHEVFEMMFEENEFFRKSLKKYI